MCVCVYILPKRTHTRTSTPMHTLRQTSIPAHGAGMQTQLNAQRL